MNNKRKIAIIIVAVLGSMLAFMVAMDFNKTSLTIEEYVAFVNTNPNVIDTEKIAGRMLRSIKDEDEKSDIIDGLIKTIFNNKERLNNLLANFTGSISKDTSDGVLRAVLDEAEKSYLVLREVEFQDEEVFFFDINYDSFLSKYGHHMSYELSFIFNLWQQESKDPAYDVFTDNKNIEIAIERLDEIYAFNMEKSSPYYFQVSQFELFYLDVILGVMQFNHLEYDADKYTDDVIEIYEKIIAGEIEAKDERIVYAIEKIQENNYILDDSLRDYLQEIFLSEWF